MDIESDDSERWEDFFGSSTDLTPSLIGLYDSLTGSLHVGQEIAEEDEKEETSTVDNSSSEGNLEPVSTAAGAIVAVNHNVVNKHRGFRVLSPNVKRLIAHSNTLVQKVECTLLPGVSYTSASACVTNGTSRASKRLNVKQKLSHIPLSRNTCKLTQSGNELVETFDATIQSSCESLDRIHSEVKDKIDSEIETDLVCANLLKDASDLSKIKEEEKLTGKVQPLQHKTSNSRRVPEIVKRFHSAQSAPIIKTDTANDKFNEMSKNIERVSQPTKIDPSNETADNSNNMSNTQTTTSDTKSRITKCTPPSSPLLTYSRIKSPAAKKSSNIQKISRKLSEESLDELTDMQPIPALNYSISPKGHRKSHFILPEIARLKHRPLSSSSICSTSSSSSSGSDHPLNGKLATSYLASVESLADQSENELLDGGSTLTVFERSCLEIVDSERIYVEDLGQVIKGYLEDWKERACLRVDELKILFSNIQDIYEFNSVLLQQLINSGMDPVKIAKCFVDLKDRFIVYTTYCTSYPAAISLLTSLLQASHTNALLTSTQKMLQHTLPLGSYLLKPVQRILKYHLLLDNLRKHCDIAEVVQAYEIMREVARSIDQVKKKLEQQSRVKELSGILDGWLGPELTVLGELRQEGLLMENNKPRMVFLFQTMLIITKPKEDNRLQFKSYIYRNNLMLREHLPGEPTSFNVIPYDEPRNQIKLTAKNRDQKRLWAQNIKGVILEQFDIPSRAKELVYKLGDEEDRTPDKSTWKWTLNSSTPVYLERRNQCRRSEIRNRSKIKRKTITNSPSLDGFNEHKNAEKRELTRQQSIDDNLITSLPKLSDGNFHKIQDCNHNGNKCECSLTEEESNRALSISSMKERSKSVPRLPQGHIAEYDDYFLTQENQNKKHDASYFYRLSNLGKTKSVKAVDVKSYNAKTIPKRIATLKKSRSKKETSRFYMDLNDMDTVLKITESTENLTTSTKNEVEIDLEKQNKTDEVKESNSIQEPEENHDKNSEEILKKDVEIISELLKEHKEFHRILKKPPKKRSFDNGSVLSSPEQTQSQYLKQSPPPPPSQSPPPLDSVDADEKPSNDENEKLEHIYESLLRNVHVPYKYSPILNRSKSQQYYTNTAQEIKVKTSQRPESDYVTLIYKENGDLKSIEGSRVNPSKVETLRKSDSNINYDSITNSEQSEKTSSVLPPEMFASMSDFQGQDDLQTKSQKNLLQRFISSKSEHVSTSENSLLAKARKSGDGLGFIRGNRPPERRVSDVSEMCRQSIIHRQGSEAVGERMAHLDYVDPRTLFSASVTSSAVSLNPQRDSVFSLTSSNDSVSDSKKNVQPTQNTASLSHDRFTYEDTVEACLENDFRDSAVYSDDSERRPETVEDDEGDKPPSTPPPPLPKKQHPGKRKPQPLPKNVTPPPIPAKPNIPLKRLSSTTSTSSSKSSIITSPTSEKSWVLQQIENFNK